jgi:hypothetical protein
MFAAAEGKSTLGIPKSVGKEFTKADPGGKLPARAAAMHPADSRRDLGKRIDKD